MGFRLLFMLIDLGGMGFGAIYGTKAITNNDVAVCIRSDDEARRYRNVVLVNVILAYIYLAFLVCMIGCFCLCGCAAFKLSAAERERLMQERLARVPMAAKAMETVNKK